jgi:hypothetical protein
VVLDVGMKNNIYKFDTKIAYKKSKVGLRIFCCPPFDNNLINTIQNLFSFLLKKENKPKISYDVLCIA